MANRQSITFITIALLVFNVGCASFHNSKHKKVNEQFDNEYAAYTPYTRKMHRAFNRNVGEWVPVSIEKSDKPPVSAVFDGINATWVGHATVLVQLDGINILTDPIWSKRASPFSFVGPKRVTAPGIELDALPDIHAIVISHSHYDHLDKNTLISISERNPKVTIIVGSGLGNLVQRWVGKDINVIELEWWQSIEITPVTSITFVPAKHYSNRGLFDLNKSLWGAFAVTSHSGNIFYAGDTGDAGHFEVIDQKYGPFDLSILPIGSYEPAYLMKDVHLSPAEAIAVHQRLRTAFSIPVHYGTFPLGDQGQYGAAEAFKVARDEANISPIIFPMLNVGETIEIRRHAHIRTPIRIK